MTRHICDDISFQSTNLYCSGIHGGGHARVSHPSFILGTNRGFAQSFDGPAGPSLATARAGDLLGDSCDDDVVLSSGITPGLGTDWRGSILQSGGHRLF